MLALEFDGPERQNESAEVRLQYNHEARGEGSLRHSRFGSLDQPEFVSVSICNENKFDLDGLSCISFYQ